MRNGKVLPYRTDDLVSIYLDANEMTLTYSFFVICHLMLTWISNLNLLFLSWNKHGFFGAFHFWCVLDHRAQAYTFVKFRLLNTVKYQALKYQAYIQNHMIFYNHNVFLF